MDSAVLPLGPGSDVDLHRCALEAEDLTQAPLDEPAVARVEEPGREQHERRRAGGGLRTEEDARLLAAAQRMRVLGELEKAEIRFVLKLPK